jgi:hypothetical protein
MIPSNAGEVQKKGRPRMMCDAYFARAKAFKGLETSLAARAFGWQSTPVSG